MSFAEKMTKLKQKIEGNLPPKYVKTMHKALAELKSTNIGSDKPKKGDTFPDFSLQNQGGDSVSLVDSLQSNKILLTFYRGVWCPYCNLDMANLEAHRKDFEAKNVQLLAISPELPEYSNKIKITQSLNFDILWDQSNEFAKKLNIVYQLQKELKELYAEKLDINLKRYNGDDNWELPIPTRFLINQDKIVEYSESSPDYRHRPDPLDILKHL